MARRWCERNVPESLHGPPPHSETSRRRQFLATEPFPPWHWPPSTHKLPPVRPPTRATQSTGRRQRAAARAAAAARGRRPRRQPRPTARRRRPTCSRMQAGAGRARWRRVRRRRERPWTSSRRRQWRRPAEVGGDDTSQREGRPKQSGGTSHTYAHRPWLSPAPTPCPYFEAHRLSRSVAHTHHALGKADAAQCAAASQRRPSRLAPRPQVEAPHDVTARSLAAAVSDREHVRRERDGRRRGRHSAPQARRPHRRQLPAVEAVYRDAGRGVDGGDGAGAEDECVRGAADVGGHGTAPGPCGRFKRGGVTHVAWLGGVRPCTRTHKAAAAHRNAILSDPHRRGRSGSAPSSPRRRARSRRPRP